MLPIFPHALTLDYVNNPKGKSLIPESKKAVSKWDFAMNATEHLGADIQMFVKYFDARYSDLALQYNAMLANNKMRIHEVKDDLRNANINYKVNQNISKRAAFIDDSHLPQWKQQIIRYTITNLVEEAAAHAVLIDLTDAQDEENLLKERVEFASRRFRSHLNMETLVTLGDKTSVTVDFFEQYHSPEPRIKATVNQKWLDTVMEANIGLVETGGSNAIVLEAIEAPEECTEPDTKLYKVRVTFIKGTAEQRDKATYWNFRRLSDSEKKQLYLDMLQDKWMYLAVQTNHTSTMQATGKDASWAQRTLRMRTKKTALKALGL